MHEYWDFYFPYHMPIIFNRIKNYCIRTQTKLLPIEKRTELGAIIIQHYIEQSGIKRPVHKTISVEPEGTFTVVSYPKIYVPEIDRQIAEFYQKNLPKVRKRIPMKNNISYKLNTL